MKKMETITLNPRAMKTMEGGEEKDSAEEVNPEEEHSSSVQKGNDKCHLETPATEAEVSSEDLHDN